MADPLEGIKSSRRGSGESNDSNSNFPRYRYSQVSLQKHGDDGQVTHLSFCHLQTLSRAQREIKRQKSQSSSNKKGSIFWIAATTASASPTFKTTKKCLSPGKNQDYYEAIPSLRVSDNATVYDKFKKELAASGGDGEEKLLLPTKEDEEEEVGEESKMEKPTTMEFLIDIVCGKVVSFFLLLIPFALWANYGGWSPIWIFCLNFLVMIPLAAILGDFTEELALHTNQIVGGLVNATFGNAVEVVVAIQALIANEIRVVQASMIGSIFSNLLLVLGCCMFFGGLIYKEQPFNSTSAAANIGLLALSSVAMVLPTPFAEYYEIDNEEVLHISRGSAVVLIFIYIQYLYFQLVSHAYLFEDENNEELAQSSAKIACIGLVVTTLLVTFFSEFLVDSIGGFCEASGISRTFVGIILLPIVGNAVEHITAVTVAMKNKMDLAMGVAVGSCTQISLFVVPLTVLVGWGLDRNMTLNFPTMEVTLYVLSVVFVSIIFSNPVGNWLEGSLLITTYVLLCVGFWYESVEDY